MANHSWSTATDTNSPLNNIVRPSLVAASLPSSYTIMHSADSSINNMVGPSFVAAPTPATNSQFQLVLQSPPSTSNLTGGQGPLQVQDFTNIDALTAIVRQEVSNLQQHQQYNHHHHANASQHQHQRGYVYVQGCNGNGNDSTHGSHSFSSTSTSTPHSLSSVQANESEEAPSIITHSDNHPSTDEINEDIINEENNNRFYDDYTTKTELHNDLTPTKAKGGDPRHLITSLEGLNGFTKTTHLLPHFIPEQHGRKRKRDEDEDESVSVSVSQLKEEQDDESVSLLKGPEHLLLTRISLENRITNLLGFEFQFTSVTHLASFLIACGGLPRYHRTTKDKDDTSVSELVSMETKSEYQDLDQDTQHAYVTATNVVNKIFLDACEPLSY